MMNKKWPIIVTAVLLAVFLSNGSIRSYAVNLFFNFFTPVFKVKQSLSGWWQNTGYVFESKKSLADENIKLKETNAELTAKQLLCDAYKKEGDDLKSLLSQKDGREYILGSVIGRPPASAYDVLIIDAGLENGVKKDAKVFVYGNVLIGYIDEVFSTSARVKMISYPGNEINAVFAEISLPVVVTGRGGGDMEAKLPNSVEIKFGDKIITEGTYSAMLGTVERIERSLTDPFQKIIFHLPVNIQEIRQVMIVKAGTKTDEIKK